MQNQSTPFLNLTCEECGISRHVPPSAFANGHGKCCSRKCARARMARVAYAKAVVRFWTKVDKNGPVPAHRPDLGPCWPWTGQRNPKGYGICAIDGVKKLAHRVSLELARGPIPSGHQAHHHCDNPPCVRDSHLTTGTPSQNSRDMVSKGRSPKNLNAPRGDAHPSRLHPERLARGDRHGSRTRPERRPRGEQHGNSKLTAAVVAEIRRAHTAGEGNQYELAARFGVHQSTVWRIVHNQAWVAPPG